MFKTSSFAPLDFEAHSTIGTRRSKFLTHTIYLWLWVSGFRNYVCEEKIFQNICILPRKEEPINKAKENEVKNEKGHFLCVLQNGKAINQQYRMHLWAFCHSKT